MKEYRLKKDLPTFKAGDEFILDRNNDLYCPEENVIAYYHEIIKKFPNILTDWFEEIPENPKTVWDLEEGDEYYIPDWDNTVGHDYWHNREKDNHRRLLGNMFLTKEEAEKELARRRAKQIILRDTKGFKPDWKECDYGVVVFWDVIDKKLVYNWAEYNDGTIRFRTDEDAEASIKSHEEEWKIYLGVDDE